MSITVETRRKAADHLFRLSALATVPESARIYDEDTHQINFDRVRDWRWSSGEEVLVDALLFILDFGPKSPTLRDIFYGVDAENRAVILEAIRILNGYEPTWT
ncbi:hypothetical protein UFOVP1608_6 [uncultured Caudovirales phage]|uniref:Uncharacterized protein n=1 Tax=uncultured Caudovirales phage TaxID=2100421 RepID=A0A6J5SS31_9CAUD|nr:hypothetical protein UFOVP1608_6 [uncultured Caudovirales phage]